MDNKIFLLTAIGTEIIGAKRKLLLFRFDELYINRDRCLAGLPKQTSVRRLETTFNASKMRVSGLVAKPPYKINITITYFLTVKISLFLKTFPSSNTLR